MNEKKVDRAKEDDLLKKESRFVSETSSGLTVDNSEAEGEPIDFGFDDDDDDA